jgi:hypothetical protein
MNNYQKQISITDFAEFQDVINTFEDCLKNMREIFNGEKNNIENINETSTWTGVTQKVIYEKHKELQKNFPSIEEALQVYIDFLKKTLSDYQRFIDTINKSTDDNSYQLNVNS